MSKAEDCKVLFVDDESQALKYFRRVYEKDFDVLTASSVDEAAAILDEQGDSIAVVITDQRMPKKTGVELLQKVREERPEIVRMLTTAYSDLDSAIEAVNSGEIFRYVTKPWDMRELRGTLLRAIDFCQVQRERDHLLCEKLSVMRRMALLDHLRTLAVLVVGLEGRLRNSAQALEAYARAIVADDHHDPQAMAAGWEDLWALNIEDSEQLVRNARKIMHVAETDGEARVAWDALLAYAESLGFQKQDNAGNPTSLPVLAADENMLKSLVAAAHAYLIPAPDAPAPTVSASQAQVRNTPGVQLALEANAAKAAASHGSVFAPSNGQRDTNLLIVFLLTYHFGGDVHVHRNRLDVLLPAEQQAVTMPAAADDWIEKLFLNLEG